MERRRIESAGAPKAIGPYSQAIRWGDLVFCSGQIPLDPATGQIAGADAASQARRCIANLRAVLEEAGSSLASCLQLNLYLARMGDFEAVNQVWNESFPDPAPARITVEVGALPRGALVEVSAVAAVR